MKNKKFIKGIAAAAIAAMSMGMLAGCGGGSDTQQDAEMHKVGIVQLMQHGALDQANQGLVEGLAAAGYVVGENLEIDQQNAQGDQSNLQSIAQQFLSNDVEMIMAIATPAAQVMAANTEEIPIVATAITSFEQAGLVESNEAPNTNVTGTHDMTPIAEQIDLLLQIVPDAKSIGTVYTSSEKNSQVQVGILKEVCEAKGLTVVERTVSTVNDIQQATQSLVEEDVDAVWLCTDNNVASAMPQVVGVTDAAGIITVCAEESMVMSGGTITYGINFYQIGYDAGLMAAKILNGEAVPAEMPIQGPKQEDLKLVINPEAVEIIGVEIPAELMEKAALTTDEAE
ncbi:MAG: ABC transporter substrate-binding protein [Peptococcaceae bacterium]|nr:ABC transporter substrate-binding protein [Peptococcaceae bacterium]MBQ5703359.1 ABC transporter substrate-binding protein [Peptococcaceae bacterium]